ncbi:MAG: hypothetical protein IPQ07_29630 [Myxococcales bacterium]|nr:hypothetical protein [Myxococcales bacterium]
MQRIAVLALILAACGGASPPTTHLPTTSAAEERILGADFTMAKPKAWVTKPTTSEDARDELHD